MWELGSFRVFGARHAVPVRKLGSFRIIRPERSPIHGDKLCGNPDFEIPGSKRDAAVGWARFVTPPVFGFGLSSTLGGIIPVYSIFVKW